MLKLPKDEVIFSVQAPAGSFMARDEVLIDMSREVVAGGAKSLRLARKGVIAEFAGQLPVIGLIKTDRIGFETRITQSQTEISDIANVGGQIVAIDSTLRQRPESLENLYQYAIDKGLEIVADIDDLISAKNAVRLGATYIATTMSGYTDSRMMTIGPDFELLENVINLGVPTLLEGRVRNAQHINRAFEMGAHAVVIGRSITSPRDIVKVLLEEIAR